MLRCLPLLAALLLLAAPSGAQPCPEISGHHVLTGDLTCDVLLLPSDTTLDLNGYTLSSNIIPGTPNDPGAVDVTLRNGTIEDSSIQFEFCSDCLLEDVHVIGRRGLIPNTLGGRNVLRRSRFTRTGFDLYFGAENTIEDCHFERGGIGVSVSTENIIRRNVFDNAGIGIYNEDFSGGSFNRIEGNLFVNSELQPPIDIYIGRCFYHPESGPRVDCAEGNVVANNLFIGNQREAIRVHPHPTQDEDQYAIHAGALIESNVFIRNGHPEDEAEAPYDTIRIEGIPEVVDGFVLRNNRVFFSGDHAIHAPGVTDGGGNRAVRSGNPEACVGVDCSPRPRRDLRPAAPGRPNGARRLQHGFESRRDS